MTTPIDKLPHPSTVPIPAACLFRWRGKRPAEIRAAIVNDVEVGRMDYETAYKVALYLLGPDSPEAKEDASIADNCGDPLLVRLLGITAACRAMRGQMRNVGDSDYEAGMTEVLRAVEALLPDPVA